MECKLRPWAVRLYSGTHLSCHAAPGRTSHKLDGTLEFSLREQANLAIALQWETYSCSAPGPTAGFVTPHVSGESYSKRIVRGAAHKVNKLSFFEKLSLLTVAVGSARHAYGCGELAVAGRREVRDADWSRRGGGQQQRRGLRGRSCSRQGQAAVGSWRGGGHRY